MKVFGILVFGILAGLCLMAAFFLLAIQDNWELGLTIGVVGMFFFALFVMWCLLPSSRDSRPVKRDGGSD